MLFFTPYITDVIILFFYSMNGLWEEEHADLSRSPWPLLRRILIPLRTLEAAERGENKIVSLANLNGRHCKQLVAQLWRVVNPGFNSVITGWWRWPPRDLSPKCSHWLIHVQSRTLLPGLLLGGRLHIVLIVLGQVVRRLNGLPFTFSSASV